MAANIGTLQAFIVADDSGLLKATRRSMAAMNRTAKTAAAMSAKVAAGFDKVGRSLTLGVTLPVIAAAAAMSKAAIDAEETANKFSVVFSSVRSDADAMAETLRKDFGLARTEARQLLSDTGDLLSGFGFTQRAALDLSSQVNELAVDLASFTNIEGGAARASAALTKALLGERESAKELGIAILEEDVKAKVLLLTKQGLTFETERQAKAYATLQIALDQSKNAIGDFERSQASTANQLRITKARFTDVAELLGTALAPTIGRMATRATELLDAFTRLDPHVQSMAVQVALVAAAAGPAAILMGKLAGAVSLAFSALASLLTVVGLIATPLGLIAAGAVAGAVALAQMIGPVDALAVGWQALEEAWTFWVKQYQTGVDFLTRKTKELRALSEAADLIGKSWVGLRLTFSLVLSGIGIMLGKAAKAFVFLAAKAEGAARLMGVELGTEGREALAKFAVEALAFGETNAQVAADTASEWGTAFSSLTQTGVTFAAATRGAFVALQNAGAEALEHLQGNAEDKAVRIQEVFDRIKGSVLTLGAKLQGEVQVAGGGGADVGAAGAGGAGRADVAGLAAAIAAAETVGAGRAQAEWEAYARVSQELAAGPEASSALQTWFDNNAATLANFSALAANTFTTFAQGFSNAVAATIVGGKSFKTAIVGIMKSAASGVIAQLIQMTIASVALAQTQTVANGVKSAPHPFLIPAFAALALAGFAAAIGGTSGASMIGGGAGSGGGGAPVAQATGPVTSTVTRDNESGGTEGEGATNGGGGTVARVVIDAAGIGNLMDLVVTESKNGNGDGSGDTLSIERG